MSRIQISKTSKRNKVMAAVQQDGYALEYASDDLKNDKDVVMAAVQQNGFALHYASDALNNDREVVMAAVQENGLSLVHACDALKNDREVVMTAVEQDGEALQFASDALKNDREVVMAAVQQGWWALEYASDDLKSDKEFIMTTVQEVWEALEYASDDLKNDKDVVMAAVQENGLSLEYASDDLKNDKDVVMAAVQEDWEALQFASDALKNDREVVMAAVQENGLALQFASDALKNDRRVVRAALDDDKCAMDFASDAVRESLEVGACSMSRNPFKTLGVPTIDIDEGLYTWADGPQVLVQFLTNEVGKLAHKKRPQGKLAHKKNQNGNNLLEGRLLKYGDQWYQNIPMTQYVIAQVDEEEEEIEIKYVYIGAGKGLCSVSVAAVLHALLDYSNRLNIFAPLGKVYIHSEFGCAAFNCYNRAFRMNGYELTPSSQYEDLIKTSAGKFDQVFSETVYFTSKAQSVKKRIWEDKQGVAKYKMFVRRLSQHKRALNMVPTLGPIGETRFQVREKSPMGKLFRDTFSEAPDVNRAYLLLKDKLPLTWSEARGKTFLKNWFRRHMLKPKKIKP